MSQMFAPDDLRHPEEWEGIEGIIVKDADGWRSTNTPWDTPISYAEFLEMSGKSTIELMRDRQHRNYTAEENSLRIKAQADTLARLLGSQ